MGMYDINTIDELVEELGGDTAVARQFGITQPAVANWKIRGNIGPGWHMRLYAELRGRHKTVNPNVFGMSEEEFAPLNGARTTGSEHVLANH